MTDDTTAPEDGGLPTLHQIMEDTDLVDSDLHDEWDGYTYLRVDSWRDEMKIYRVGFERAEVEPAEASGDDITEITQQVEYQLAEPSKVLEAFADVMAEVFDRHIPVSSALQFLEDFAENPAKLFGRAQEIRLNNEAMAQATLEDKGYA